MLWDKILNYIVDLLTGKLTEIGIQRITLASDAEMDRNLMERDLPIIFLMPLSDYPSKGKSNQTVRWNYELIFRTWFSYIAHNESRLSDKNIYKSNKALFDIFADNKELGGNVRGFGDENGELVWDNSYYDVQAKTPNFQGILIGCDTRVKWYDTFDYFGPENSQLRTNPTYSSRIYK